MAPQPTDDHSRKKRKASRDGPPSSNNQDTLDLPQKSSQFWFNDGNIILKTQKTQYRVHRGVLSIQSSVFEDMFDIPQPELSAQPLLEGCPFVAVTDSAEDWDALLGLLYNMEVYIPSTHTYPLGTMLAMLRLGHKYNFARFKAEGLRQLGIIFLKTPRLRGEIFFEDTIPEAKIIKGCEFRTVRAIEDLQIQSALPTAYFSCILNRNLEEIAAGRDTPDGPVFLSPQTRNVLMVAKERLIATYPSLAYQWLSSGELGADCTDTEVCTDEIIKLMAKLLKNPTDLRLIDMDQPPNIFYRSNLCDACRDAGLESFYEGRRTIFRLLPSYFNLPTWDQLKDM